MTVTDEQLRYLVEHPDQLSDSGVVNGLVAAMAEELLMHRRRMTAEVNQIIEQQHRFLYQCAYSNMFSGGKFSIFDLF